MAWVKPQLTFDPIRLLLYLLVLLPVTVTLADQPTPFSASYELLLNRLPVGHQTLSLQQTTPDTFKLETRLTPNRLAKLFRNSTREESSNFLWKDNIISQHYRLDRHDQKTERHAELAFDWSRQQVTNDVAGERWQMPIPPGTLDKLNVQIAVMQDLAKGKTAFSYDIADGGKLKQYRFEVITRQTIRTPAGKFETLKIRRRREDQERITYLWCAPALKYLPVQIQQIESEDEHTYLSRLTRHEFHTQPAMAAPDTSSTKH